MSRTNRLPEGFERLSLVFLLLGFIIATGCGSSDNVLTPPEGGAPPAQVKPNTPKANPKMSTRQEREKAASQ
jgi:hypothetical protein